MGRIRSTQILGAMAFTTLISANLCLAETLKVNIDGSEAYERIQDAIDAASTGDRVKVYPGTYSELIDFQGKDIMVFSTAGFSKTIISAKENGSGSTVTFSSGESRNAVLEGFSIQDGFGTAISEDGNPLAGGGIYITNAASPTIRRCEIKNNEANLGAGIGIIGAENYSSPLIQNCTITNNLAFETEDETFGHGGGVAVWTDFEDDPLSTALFKQTTFKKNQVNSNCFGGSLYAANADLELNNCLLMKSGASTGGGAYLYCAQYIFNKVTFKSNNAIISGGAYLRGSQGSMKNCVFTKNYASSNGGLKIDYFVEISKTKFTKNTADTTQKSYAVAIDITNLAEYSNSLNKVMIKNSEGIDERPALRIADEESGPRDLAITDCTVKNNKGLIGIFVNVIEGVPEAQTTLEDTIVCKNLINTKGDYIDNGGNTICDD